MKSNVQRKKSLCAVCGGTLRHTTIAHEEKRGSHLYLFDNVPARVCAACREVWIDESTLQDIDQLIRKGKPVRTVETPVYDLAAGGAR